MSAIQIKCYLLPDDCKIAKKSVEKATEIRRFNVERIGSGLYENLLEKILTYFKNVFENKNEIKTYYLDDEDELIGFSSDSEFQYGMDVQLALKMSNAQYNAAQNIFKIYIIKRKKVDSTESSTLNDETMPSCEQQQQHCGVVCDGCNGSIIGIRYKCAICPDYDLCSTCEAKGIHKDTEHKLIKIGFPQFFRPKCGRYGHHKRHHKHFNNMFGDMYSNIMGSVNKVNDPEHLKKFGEYLKGALEPFGIDVDYYVDSVMKKKEEKTEEKQNETKMDTQPSEEPKVDSLKKESTVGMEKKTSESSLITIDTNEKAQATSLTASISTASAAATPATVTATTITTSTSTTTTTPKVFPSLNSEKTSLSTRPHEDVDGFNMVDMEKEVKIMKAVEQLKEMGFDDQNNWLTSLVTSKDGNINAVLDALSPFQFKY